MPSDLSDPQDENPASARLDHGNDATPSDASNSPRKEERPVRNDPKVSTSLRLLSGTNELLKRVAKRSGHGNLHQFALRAISEKIERLDYPSIEEIDRLTESQLDALHAGPPKRDRSD